ncbi:MAG: dihydropteroate synthase [Myxococcota bacterium]
MASSEGSRCGIWGVLNVTPDSFSDGGRFLGRDQALAQARAMLAAGADVIDVGGESTRPRGKDYGAGADEVDAAEEAARVVPIIAALAREGTQVSVDTRKGEVAERAIAAGARIVNDVSGGSDPSLLAACAKSGVSLVLMHNRGRGEVVPPQTTYGDVVSDVRRELSERVTKAVDAGVAEGRLWLDPGLGFAKTAAQSGTLLARLPELVGLGFPVLVGASRKSFIARLAPLPDGGLAEPAAREAGGAAAVALAIAGGAKAVRVHDVASAWQAARFAEAVLAARGSA